MKHRLLWIVAAAAFAGSAVAQIDLRDLASELHARFGPPLARETFVIPGGEMIVDYGSTGNICRIQLPAMAPEKNRPGITSTKAMDEFVLELVPMARRGKETGRVASATGAAHASSVVVYENVAIAESLLNGQRIGVFLTFQKEPCPERTAAQ
jgi:hypothetical protein